MWIFHHISQKLLYFLRCGVVAHTGVSQVPELHELELHELELHELPIGVTHGSGTVIVIVSGPKAFVFS